MDAPDQITGREALTARVIPRMILNDGSSSFMTPPPSSTLASDPQTGAKARFTVSGNAIVTGGSGTLGLHACEALLEHGLSGLAIFDINPANAQREIDWMKAKFPDANIFATKVDVSDENAVAAAVNETTRQLGSVDKLLCFAGVVCSVHSLDMPIAQWRKVIDINTTSAFICAQATARQMVKQGSGGSIVFISSISGHRVNFPQPQAAYNVSKAAILSLKSNLAAEWARYGIRTNSISPGYMDTILNEGDGLCEHRKIWAAHNPSGRMGCPAELTGTVVLLSSDAGSYINGTDIVVDGGGIVF